MDREQALEDPGECAPRELTFDPGHETEDGGLALVVRERREASESAAEALIEGALARARDRGIVEPVVSERIQHAVREEAVPQLDSLVEQHLDAVPDPDVAQGLTELLEGEARIEGLRLPGERDRGLEEGVPEQQPPVAVRPSEPLLAEGLQALAKLLAPGVPPRLVVGDALEPGAELVDQPGCRTAVRELTEEPDACADLGQLGRRRRPERELLVAQLGGSPSPGDAARAAERQRSRLRVPPNATTHCDG